MRSAIPVLLIAIAIASIAAMGFLSVPQSTSSTSYTTFMSGNVYPVADIFYSYSTATCLVEPSTSCYILISPYTSTETYSAQITETVPLASVSTSYVPFAFAGPYEMVALIIAVALLLAGILTFVRKR